MLLPVVSVLRLACAAPGQADADEDGGDDVAATPPAALVVADAEPAVGASWPEDDSDAPEQKRSPPVPLRLDAACVTAIAYTRSACG